MILSSFLLIMCQPTYKFIAKKTPILITKKPNKSLKIRKLNKFNKNCQRTGWHIITSGDTSVIAKFKGGDISGRFYAIDENYQIIQKGKVKNGQLYGLLVLYHPIYVNICTAIDYYDKNGFRTIIKPHVRMHYKFPYPCNYEKNITDSL